MDVSVLESVDNTRVVSVLMVGPVPGHRPELHDTRILPFNK